MKKLALIWLVITLSVSGCSYSLQESYIRSKRPDSLKKYTNGPISPLSQDDVSEAIEFGKANRHRPDVIKYAFLFTSKITPLGPTSRVYILVDTNYFLIADYAANQTKKYEQIDMNYVNFLAALPTFRIETLEQITYAFQRPANFVLMKNGVKVEPSNFNPLYENASPYTYSHISEVQSNLQAIIDETMKNTMAMANQIAEQYKTNMQIDIPTTSVGRPENIYDYKDIDLNAKYEVVILYRDGEKRIPIDFSNTK